MDIQFDICIIGSGPAGAFAARSLADYGKNVVVIEAGGKDVDSEPSNIIDIENSDIPGTPDFGFSQQIGGASNLWAGGLVELDDIDFVQRPKFGFNGWPYEKNILIEYYKKVNDYIKIDPNKINEDLLENSNIHLRDINVLDTPFVTTKLIENIENLTIRDMNVAVKLIVDGKDKIEAVEVYDKKENTYKKIYAKQFIVASGTLTNVRLLLHSFHNIKHDISELYENIGKYFSTHPKGDIGTLKLYKPLEHTHQLVAIENKNSFTHWYQFGLDEKYLLKHDLLNHCIRFSSPFHQRATRIFDMMKKAIGTIPLFRDGKFANILVKLGIYIFRFIDHTRFFSFNNKSLVVRGFFDQQSLKTNRITLSKKTSEEGLPLAKIDYEFNENDWEEVERFIEEFSKELKELGIGEIEYKRPTNDKFTGMHSHFIGGTRMGKSSGDSVVDKNLKVHGFDNLYVSGPSTFPSFGYANPFYSIAAISLKLSDYLKGIHD